MDKQKSTTINRLLKERGIKQKEIASQLGVTPQFVNAVIRGKRSTNSIQKAIADAIGLDIDQVFPVTKEAA